ncbi:MAG: D-tyrosyl-tRNA(Tyr) deacylase [Deltaproteobacteria bacterium]|nr:D-tyrosyl-tRNA(Tyr) deacylase [Deltaproteobacteria bacterium]
MRALIQRVSMARVRVDDAVVGEIGQGLLILLGVAKGDDEADVENLAPRAAHLRIFPDEAGKMNRSLVETGGQALVVSQFTLYGDCRKGRRPSFVDAADPLEAERLYGAFMRRLEKEGVAVAAGKFQAMMEVELVNNGPVTLMLESRK